MQEEKTVFRLPARFLSAGQCVAHPGWIHPQRVLDSFVLIAVERGCFGIYIGEERFVARSGEMLLLPAGVPHSGFPVAKEESPVYCWVHFENGVMASGHQVCVDSLRVTTEENVYHRIVNLFHQLINESSVGNTDLTCDYILSLLLLELRGNRETSRAVLTNRVIEYVRLHYTERLSLDEMNRVFGYSGDYLSRLFHEDMQIPLRQYIHQLRVQRAKAELVSSGKPVGVIAAECGYVNTKFFSTVFLKQEGVTPSAYRNLYGRLHQNDA